MISHIDEVQDLYKKFLGFGHEKGMHQVLVPIKRELALRFRGLKNDMMNSPFFQGTSDFSPSLARASAKGSSFKSFESFFWD
jgi:hypothetical protein